jgi:hypothetical protein
LRLQAARQNEGESPKEFAVRCRVLCQKTVMFSPDPQIQNIYVLGAELRLLAVFMSSPSGQPGQQVCVLLLKILSEAVQIATTFYEAQTQDKS